jgi:hypothetical protein
MSHEVGNNECSTASDALHPIMQYLYNDRVVRLGAPIAADGEMSYYLVARAAVAGTIPFINAAAALDAGTPMGLMLSSLASQFELLKPFTRLGERLPLAGTSGTHAIACGAGDRQVATVQHAFYRDTTYNLYGLIAANWTAAEDTLVARIDPSVYSIPAGSTVAEYDPETHGYIALGTISSWPFDIERPVPGYSIRLIVIRP